MRNFLVAALILAGTIAMPATAQVHVSIGINLPSYPVLQQVPGYPVYYAPRLNSNYFFYDGLYWVYEGDNWYASDWYNGPWELVDRYEVPVFLLRVPVRYYRSAPVYFRGWRADAAPRWGDHWGSSWQQRRSGWDRWDRRSVPSAAPLPVYQRQYSGSRYPDRSRQVVIQTQSYRYQPRETVVRQRFEQRRASVPAEQLRAPVQQRREAAQVQQRREAQVVQQRREAQVVQQRREAAQVQQRREAPVVQQRREAQVQQRREAPVVQQRREAAQAQQRRETQVQREAQRRATVQRPAPAQISQAPVVQGHPSAQAKGKGPEQRAARVRGNEGRGKGQDNDRDDRGKGRDR